MSEFSRERCICKYNSMELMRPVNKDKMAQSKETFWEDIYSDRAKLNRDDIADKMIIGIRK